MKSFEGKFAVVTGAGTGMGRELARQLAAEGCNLALCDVSASTLKETSEAIEGERPPQGTRITTHLADVAKEEDLKRFRDEASRRHETDALDLLFNNAGIGGGGSFVGDPREEWERTFNVCWGGVYLGCRTFMEMLLRSKEAHIVNTASVNGFWASIGPTISHTAYSAAKFAVKGFTEALITDLRLNAPHVRCSVVMPGHIGTSIVSNSRRVLRGRDDDDLSKDDILKARQRLVKSGFDAEAMSDQDIVALAAEQARRFLEDAPTTAAEAAKIILDGVRQQRWRILVGADAEAIDDLVRKAPEDAYEPAFHQELVRAAGWRL